MTTMYKAKHLHNHVLKCKYVLNLSSAQITIIKILGTIAKDLFSYIGFTRIYMLIVGTLFLKKKCMKLLGQN